MQKSNGTWTPGAQSNTVANHTGLTVYSNYIDVEVVLSNGAVGTYSTGSESLTPVTYPHDYYHECVYSALGEQENSTVIATGTLTVNKSIFTSIAQRRA